MSQSCVNLALKSYLSESWEEGIRQNRFFWRKIEFEFTSQFEIAALNFEALEALLVQFEPESDLCATYNWTRNSNFGLSSVHGIAQCELEFVFGFTFKFWSGCSIQDWSWINKETLKGLNIILVDVRKRDELRCESNLAGMRHWVFCPWWVLRMKFRLLTIFWMPWSFYWTLWMQSWRPVQISESHRLMIAQNPAGWTIINLLLQCRLNKYIANKVAKKIRHDVSASL